MDKSRASFALLFAFLATLTAPRVAEAQFFNRGPADGYDSPDPSGDRDSSNLSTRVDRLERELRKATGRIEELQHQVQGLEDQLRARQDAAAPPPVADRRPLSASGGGASPHASASAGDAFDPAANPSAAGAPRQLGQTTASAPLAAPAASRTAAHEPGAPMDLTPPGMQGAASPPPEAAAAASDPVKEEFAQAEGLIHSQQYEAAERAFTAFLEKYPKSKYLPAATYGLGESFFLRQRYSDAARKFLDIKTKYPKAAQAPQALLRLGQSLAEIGASGEACAAYAEIGASYPGSPANVRDSALRERKKLQC